MDFSLSSTDKYIKLETTVTFDMYVSSIRYIYYESFCHLHPLYLFLYEAPWDKIMALAED
jgi:hypothetical protein